MAVQPDGKILLGGSFTQVNGTSRSYLARVNSDGSLDTGFNAPADYYVYSLLVRTNGKILVGGEFTHLNNEAHNYLVQLNADGSTDSGFTANVVNTTLGSNVTSASATGLTTSTTYYFRVQATNANGASSWSNAASATTRRH